MIPKCSARARLFTQDTWASSITESREKHTALSPERQKAQWNSSLCHWCSSRPKPTLGVVEGRRLCLLECHLYTCVLFNSVSYFSTKESSHPEAAWSKQKTKYGARNCWISSLRKGALWWGWSSLRLAGFLSVFDCLSEGMSQVEIHINRKRNRNRRNRRTCSPACPAVKGMCGGPYLIGKH